MRRWRACRPATAARRSGRVPTTTTTTAGPAGRTACTAGESRKLPKMRLHLAMAMRLSTAMRAHASVNTINLRLMWCRPEIVSGKFYF